MKRRKKQTLAGHRRSSAAHKGVRTTKVHGKPGHSELEIPWERASSHAAGRFVDRFRPDLVLEEAVDLLEEVGKTALLIGDSPGGKMYFSPLYPMCAFIARDSPGMLVTVLDRPMMPGRISVDDSEPAKKRPSTPAISDGPALSAEEDDCVSRRQRRVLRKNATMQVFFEIRIRQEELLRRLRLKGMEDPSTWENTAEIRLGYTGVKEPPEGWSCRWDAVTCSPDLAQWMRNWYGVDDEDFRQALVATLMSDREEVIPYPLRVRVVRSWLGHLLVFVMLQNSSSWVLDMIVPPIEEI